MEHFKLKIGLGLIPIFGLIIVLFWGMFSTYSIFHKRTNAFIYAMISMAGWLIVSIPILIAFFLFLEFADTSNTSLLGIWLGIISIIWTYFMTAVCLGVQYIYCKKLSERKNLQYIS